MSKGLHVALWADNGNMLSAHGCRFFAPAVPPTHPPDGMRVKAEAGNDCATWEIIQLSDQSGGHKRSHYLRQHCWSACEEAESWCVSAALTSLQSCESDRSFVWKKSKVQHDTILHPKSLELYAFFFFSTKQNDHFRMYYSSKTKASPKGLQPKPLFFFFLPTICT